MRDVLIKIKRLNLPCSSVFRRGMFWVVFFLGQGFNLKIKYPRLLT